MSMRARGNAQRLKAPRLVIVKCNTCPLQTLVVPLLQDNHSGKQFLQMYRSKLKCAKVHRAGVNKL